MVFGQPLDAAAAGLAREIRMYNRCLRNHGTTNLAAGLDVDHIRESIAA